MRKLALSFLAMVLVASTAPLAFAKGKRAEKAKGPAPVAKSAEINELRGEYKWGMTPQQVLEKVHAKIDESFKEQVEKYRTDPAKSDSVRRQIKVEKDKVTKSLVKFDGSRGGWDVSIIDDEFLQNNGESMLFNKEPKQTRYFFFSGDNLYKMFIAFDKDVIGGKSFEQFGEAMQQKYGKAQVVYRDVVLHGMKNKVLDGFHWRSAEGDGLRLVDRSKFYDVYCLVIYDQNVAERQAEAKKSRAGQTPKGSFVDSVIDSKPSDRDENDNVVDRITGKEVLKPGDNRGGNQNIKVPSPSSGGKGEMKAEDPGF